MKQLGASADREAEARFRREVRIQKTLRHPNVVSIVSSDLDASPPYFLMPLAEMSLRKRLEALHGEDELWVWLEVAEGVVHAHANGVIHRDIKPENVLFFQDPGGDLRAAIGDFGLGRLMVRDTTTLTVTNIGVGTVAYMAPEQLSNAKDVDERADIYSLGKLLAEILTGNVPFPAIDYVPIPPRYQYVIRKATAMNPAERYSSVAFLLEQVRALDSSENATSSADLVKAELKKVVGTRNLNADNTEELARLFCQNVDDTAALSQLLPTVPQAVLHALLKFHLDAMLEVLKAYDQEVSGGLPFEYCDTVADFYNALFDPDGPAEVNVIILRRLPQMGAHHNRWYVGGVFARLLTQIKSARMVNAAVEAIGEVSPPHLHWCMN